MIPCQITNLDFSGIVQNLTGAYSGTLATSATGKYVTVANQGYNTNSGNIFVSSNFGTSYSDTGVVAVGNGTWQQIAMSQTGQYQYAVISNTPAQGNLFVSTNYGANWSDSLFGVPNGWQSINVSSDGKYVTAVQSGNIASPLETYGHPTITAHSGLGRLPKSLFLRSLYWCSWFSEPRFRRFQQNPFYINFWKISNRSRIGKFNRFYR